MQPQWIAAALLAAGFVPPAPVSSDELLVSCPPENVKVLCGEPTDPSVTGEPTISGGCPPYTIMHSDVVRSGACPAKRFTRTITRTWTISDTCGHVASCMQFIHELKQVVSLDLHPLSCPNPFARSAGGKYPAAILGSPTLDVTTILPESVQLWGFACNGGPVLPIPDSFHYVDVSAPYTGDESCGCTTEGPDGFVDLIFKFERSEMNSALNLAQYPDFTDLQLVIVGDLTDGCRFIGVDCIRVQ